MASYICYRINCLSALYDIAILETGKFNYKVDTVICSWSTFYYQPRGIIPSSNSETFTSELLENLEEMFLQYYTMHINMSSMLKSSTIWHCLTRADTVKVVSNTINQKDRKHLWLTSPSKVNTKRNTPWAAGCWGPKFRVIFCTFFSGLALL